jgi:hypothetical protein
MSRQRAGKPENRDSIYGTGNRFVCSISVRIIAGAHPASYVMLNAGYLFGVKWPWREIDHSPTSTAEVKISGTIPPIHIRLHGVHKYNFTQYFLIVRHL